MTINRYTLSGDRMFPHSEGRWVFGEDYDALRARHEEVCASQIAATREAESLRSRLAEAERNEETLLGMIRHQRDVLRECLPYINESMAGRRPGRCADDIRAAVKALTADSVDARNG